MDHWHDIDTNAAVKTLQDLVFGQATAISEHGVRLLLDRALQVGDPVDVKLVIPPTQTRVVASAVVREVAEDGGRYDTELALRQMGDEARAAIDALLAHASERAGRRKRTTRPMRAATPAPGTPVPHVEPGRGGASVRRPTGRARVAQATGRTETAGGPRASRPGVRAARPSQMRNAVASPPQAHDPRSREERGSRPSVRTAHDRRPSARMSAARRRLLQTDRRSEPRAPVTMPVTVSRDGVTEVTTTVDVSRGGMFLRVSLPTSYERDEPLRVELAGLDGLPLSLDARVANVVVKGARVGVGVQFVNASDNAALAFAQLLRMIGL